MEINMTKITEDYLNSQIVKVEYIKMGMKTVICMLTLENGFEIIGTSACVDVSKFNMDIGKEYAYENAFNKLWELEGYVLQSKLKESL